MTIPSQYTTLITRLLNLTKRGKLPWEKVTKGLDTFRIELRESSIQIHYDDVLSETFEVTIFNAEGDQIESFEIDEEDDGGYNTVNELYRAARRHALHVDQTIEGLDRQLGEMEGSK